MPRLRPAAAAIDAASPPSAPRSLSMSDFTPVDSKVGIKKIKTGEKEEEEGEGGEDGGKLSNRAAPDPSSSRAINCGINVFLSPEVLGRPVSAPGKATVMAMGNGGRCPKFSKMSGVAEWKNCVFLWVNAFDDRYSNVFTEDG